MFSFGFFVFYYEKLKHFFQDPRRRGFSVFQRPNHGVRSDFSLPLLPKRQKKRQLLETSGRCLLYGEHSTGDSRVRPVRLSQMGQTDDLMGDPRHRRLGFSFAFQVTFDVLLALLKGLLLLFCLGFYRANPCLLLSFAV